MLFPKNPGVLKIIDWTLCSGIYGFNLSFDFRVYSCWVCTKCCGIEPMNMIYTSLLVCSALLVLLDDSCLWNRGLIYPRVCLCIVNQYESLLAQRYLQFDTLWGDCLQRTLSLSSCPRSENGIRNSCGTPQTAVCVTRRIYSTGKTLRHCWGASHPVSLGCAVVQCDPTILQVLGEGKRNKVMVSTGQSGIGHCLSCHWSA